MDTEDHAAPYGKLSEGITIEHLIDAVSQSGHPFQAVVTEVLESKLKAAGHPFPQVQEEWAYVDRESGDVRAIDIFADVSFASTHREDGATPRLNILLECKKSNLPYVFFLRANPPTVMYDFPEFAGLRQSGMAFFAKNEDGSYRPSMGMSLHDVFETAEIDFFDTPCPYAISISKVARRGSKLELTGEEAYRAITLPLMKAADHLKEITEPKEGQPPHACHLVLCVAVINGPMYGAYYKEGRNHLLPVPWVRACRLEPGSRGTQSSVRYFDVVHESHLSEYFELALDAMETLGKRIDKNSAAVADGRALASTEAPLYEYMEGIPRELTLPTAREIKYWVARIRSRNILDVKGGG